MPECDASKRSTTSWIVDHIGDDTFNVTVSLTEIEGTEPRRSLTVMRVRSEDRSCSLTLSTNDTSHPAAMVLAMTYGDDDGGLEVVGNRTKQDLELFIMSTMEGIQQGFRVWFGDGLGLIYNIFF